MRCVRGLYISGRFKENQTSEALSLGHWCSNVPKKAEGRPACCLCWCAHRLGICFCFIWWVVYKTETHTSFLLVCPTQSLLLIFLSMSTVWMGTWNKPLNPLVRDGAVCSAIIGSALKSKALNRSLQFKLTNLSWYPYKWAPIIKLKRSLET